MNLFGNNQTAAPSLTESIFGTSATNNPPSNDLFSKSIPKQTTAVSRKRPRTSSSSDAKKKETSLSSFAKEEVPKETPQQTLHRRNTQAQDTILDQVTLSTRDYPQIKNGSDNDELNADVRSLMKHHGLVIIRNALSEKDVSTITTFADATQRYICDALDAKKIPYNLSVADEETFVYKELAVRCKGRMDVRYDDNVTTADKQQSQLPTSTTDLIENLAVSILHGAEPPSLVYSGWIFSHPESASQPWHTDGSPLFGDGAVNGSLPSYAINIFVGLHDADESLVLGPTEFVVGSHTMNPEVVMDTMIDRAVPAVIGKGDILLYDYRICHRGTANLSSSISVASSTINLEPGVEQDHEAETNECGVVRKVLYQMYARPWFKEHLNFGDQSLFDDDDENDVKH